MAEFGVQDIPMVGVAKGVDRNLGKEEFYRIGKPVFGLPRNDPVLYFIQRMRDEAHRFAIGSHRAKRSKAIGASPLDEIAGVGGARKRALLDQPHRPFLHAVNRVCLGQCHALRCRCRQKPAPAS